MIHYISIKSTTPRNKTNYATQRGVDAAATHDVCIWACYKMVLSNVKIWKSKEFCNNEKYSVTVKNILLIGNDCFEDSKMIYSKTLSIDPGLSGAP